MKLKRRVTRKTTSVTQAGQVDFALHSLGWRDFQNLCVTVVGEVLGQTVQSFCATNDAGRDGAFQGMWEPKPGMALNGTFVVQCKFSAKPNAQLRLADLADEIPKAQRLASAGLADNYVLMTNCVLSARADEAIRGAFEAIAGIRCCVTFGLESITRLICESQRLRMLVPRVYGLGDLSQILDERAYRQAREILTSLRDELAKFVITGAFRKSVKALNKHGFVLLLGEPACGKSTIASALALAAADRWGCQLVKVRDAAHFEERWNPDEPKQFFWVDDALGPTQYERDAALAWNREFPHLDAALKCGARVVFTSRDYIYREALADLKESAFPLLRESQVVIEVSKLSGREREQILYNHLRLGSQPPKFRTNIKPMLSAVAAHYRFLPEIARRLAHPTFTRNLSLVQSEVLDFVANPQAWLCDVIKTLDDPTRAALALIFMNGGKLRSPLKLGEEEQKALILLNASVGTARKALTAQESTLVVTVMENGKHWWAFKHPTIRDAFGALIASERELMDIYLAGTPAESLVDEIVCGRVVMQGAKVIVPEDRYDRVLTRIEELPDDSWEERRLLHGFLERRCDRNFLKRYLDRHPQFIQQLRVQSWLAHNPDVRLIGRLHELKLLPEAKRREFVEIVSRIAISQPDADFLEIPNLRAIFRAAELRSVLRRVREELLPQLEKVISEWSDRYDGDEDDDPNDHFFPLRDALETYQRAFGDSRRTSPRLEKALDRIEKKVEELKTRESTKPDEEIASTDESEEDIEPERSVFEDVDA